MPTYHYSPVAGRYLRCKAMTKCRYGSSNGHLTEEQYALVQSGEIYDRDAHVARQPRIIFANLTERFIGYENGSDRWESRIAPAGVRGVYCTGCNHYFTETDYQTIVATNEAAVADTYKCVHCGQPQWTGTVGIDMRHEDARLLDDEVCRTTPWFHVTNRKNWFESINQYQNGGLPLVHLGTREAAMDRMRDLRREHAKTTPTEPEGDYYLYEVRLRPETKMALGITEDFDDDWPKNTAEATESERYPFFNAMGVTRYLNRYEAQGSISLLANPRVLVNTAAIKVPLT